MHDRITAPAAVSGRAEPGSSSIVRDSRALTERQDVISFAGGLPAAELFDVDGGRVR